MFDRLARLSALLIFLLAPTSTLPAQSAPAEKAVREVLRQMIDADLKDDASELDRTLAADYVIIRDNGVVRSRAETLDGIDAYRAAELPMHANRPVTPPDTHALPAPSARLASGGYPGG